MLKRLDTKQKLKINQKESVTHQDGDWAYIILPAPWECYLGELHVRVDIEVQQDLTNLFPGHPPKPVGHTNSGASEVLPSDLDPYGSCQWTEKWDEHRVILFNGLAFSRVGDLYSKLPDTYTHKVAKYLEKCFKIHEYFVFDVGFMSHGPMKGNCFLYDIPQHKGTFRARNAIMRHVTRALPPQLLVTRISMDR